MPVTSTTRWRDGAHELIEVAGSETTLPSSTSSRSSVVAVAQLVEQRSVLDRSGDHLPDAPQEVEVLAVVARARVEDVDEADHPVAGDQRDAELASIAVLGQSSRSSSGEARVVEVGDDHDLPAAHRDGRRGEGVEVERRGRRRSRRARSSTLTQAAQPLVLRA